MTRRSLAPPSRRSSPAPRALEDSRGAGLSLAIRAATLSFACVLAPIASQAADAPIGKVEVTLELPRDKPYVGEMIMLRMRSFIRAHVVLDDVRQPPMINFDVQQMGRDKPIQAMVDGFSVDGIERDLAIYPDQAGRLNIPPFVRHVTIIDVDSRRVEIDFASKPVFVDVQNHTAINPAGAWWLPAKSLTITETWSPEPDEIDQGALTRRTIVVEAAGLNADRLPPPPDMRAPGIITFRGPVQRETILSEDGPTARATYVWDLRPATGAPARMPAVTLPWFDTGERRMRTAALPERWVAYVGTFVHPSHEKLRGFRDQVLAPAPLAAGLLGFAWSAALIGFVVGARRTNGGRRSRTLSRLKRAGRFRDEPSFRHALGALARSDPARWRNVSSEPGIASRLVALDSARYAREGGSAPPLAPLAADIRRLWNAAGAEREGQDRDLPSLDGLIARKSTWRERLGRQP